MLKPLGRRVVEADAHADADVGLEGAAEAGEGLEQGCDVSEHVEAPAGRERDGRAEPGGEREELPGAHQWEEPRGRGEGVEVAVVEVEGHARRHAEVHAEVSRLPSTAPRRRRRRQLSGRGGGERGGGGATTFSGSSSRTASTVLRGSVTTVPSSRAMVIESASKPRRRPVICSRPTVNVTRRSLSARSVASVNAVSGGGAPVGSPACCAKAGPPRESASARIGRVVRERAGRERHGDGHRNGRAGPSGLHWTGILRVGRRTVSSGTKRSAPGANALFSVA